MSVPQQHTRTFGEIVSDWWQDRKQGQPRNAGDNSAKPRTLAGKWPDSADLLSQRLAALQLTQDAATRDGK